MVFLLNQSFTDVIHPQLLRRYDFAIAKPEKPMKLWSAGFWITHDFWLRITQRGRR